MYHYLGLDINETLNFAHGVKIQHDAGGRALGALTAKYYASKGFSFKTYSKLYSSTIIPVTDYAAGVWGFKNYDDINKLQHRAIQTFLGVGKQTSLVALDGETGLNSPLYRRHCDIIRLWHRLSRLPVSRVAKRACLGHKKNSAFRRHMVSRR